MTLTAEYLTYPTERAVAWLQKKKVPWTVYGPARSCKAVLKGDTWEPAGYTEDGKTPHQNGVDVILFPMIQDGEIYNIVAFQPGVVGLYLRYPDNNLWAFLELLEGIVK